MHCYCLQIYNSWGSSKLLTFDFKDVGSNNNKNYCSDWLANYTYQQSLIYFSSFTVIIVNVLVCWILQIISIFEKHHTLNAESVG